MATAPVESPRPGHAACSGCALCIAAGESILNKAGIPTYMYPDNAAEAFTYMWKYTRNLQSIYETVDFAGSGEGANLDRKAAKAMIDGVRKSGRTLLAEAESKQLLATYNIPITPSISLAAWIKPYLLQTKWDILLCLSCTRKLLRIKRMLEVSNLTRRM